MNENSFQIKDSSNKEEFYSEFSRQIRIYLEGEKNLITQMATMAAALGESRRFLWAGFYLVDGNELVLGPFSGPLACFRIRKGQGVCGKAWVENNSLLVPNVHEFPGHIACSSLSNSEIVVPIRKDGKVIAVMDIDHTEISGLDSLDLKGLEQIAALIG
jgi:L-methionine (R)-S-oxide reductase